MNNCDRCKQVDEILRSKELKRAERLAAIALLFIEPDQVDDYIGVSPSTVRRAMKKGFSPHTPLSPLPYWVKGKGVEEQCLQVGQVDYTKSNRRCTIIENFTPRQRQLWDLITTVQFGTTQGPQTVLRNVSQPELLCESLGSEYYQAVDLEREIRTAAAWTLSRAKNRKTNLGTFLTNWFNNALDRAPKKPHTNGAAFKPL
jgi:hypothetical protein